MARTRWFRSWSVSTFVVAAACGPDLVERAELDEICGQPAPFRLLELDPEERLAGMGFTILGERRIVSLRYLDPETFDPLIPGREEVWSIGKCGESPRLLAEAEDLSLAAYPDVWPDVWPDVILACDDTTGEVLALDPEGARPTNVVLELPDCDGTPTPHGMITVEAHDEDLGALVLQPWPDDPFTERAPQQVLLDPIRIRAVPRGHAFPTFHEVTAFTDDQVFVLTAEDELVSLQLPDGPPVVEATGVREFELSHDPEHRFLAWQDVEITNENEEWPEGAVYVRDRTTGTTAYLADAAIAAQLLGALQLAEFGLFGLRLGEPYRQRIWSWPSMSTVDLPLGTMALGPIPDGRLLISDVFGGPYALFDLTTQSVEPLFEADGHARTRDDGLEVFDGPECCINSDFRAEGGLWLVTWDGQRERLARRVTWPYAFLPDDRVLTTVDVGEDWLGTMIVVEPETLDEQQVDDRVLFGWKPIDDEGEVVYAVHDGDRTGLWATKLAR